jgi:Zn finger protein HypA/HybF involved in hydrogenase expression
MSTGWMLLSVLLPPAAAALAGFWFHGRPADPLITIGLNALMPGSGLAAGGRPTLEVVLGVMFAQASLLITGGPANIGFLVPIMLVGGLWASAYTRFNPIVLAASDPTRRSSSGAIGDAVARPPSNPRDAASADGLDLPNDDAGYEVQVPCTECGAQLDVPVLAHMARCDFCGSEHLVVGHDDTLYVTIPERVRDQAGLRDAVLDHYRYQHYLKLYRASVAPLEAGATESSSTGTLVSRPEASAAVAAAERAVSKKADLYRAKLASSLEVGDTQHFLAPYRHGMGTLYQAAYGRSPQDQEKHLQFAIGIVEAALLATEAVTLPAMGKLSYLRSLVPAALCDSDVKSLPLDVDESALADAFGDLDRKRLVRDLDVIRLGSKFSREVTAVVWRPWWITEARGPGIQESLLVDGAAGSVAGSAPRVAPESLRELPEIARAPGSGLRFVPMECPTCGHEYRFDTDAVLHFCVNCHRVCEVAADRKREVEYLHQSQPSLDGSDLVPFWYFPLRIRTADGQLITDLRHYRDGIDGTLDQIGEDAPMERHAIAVPAIRCINPRLMKLAFRGLLHHTLRHPPNLTRGRFPLDSTPRPWSVSLCEAEARTLLPLYLADVLGRRDLARVNVNQASAWLFEATQEATGKLAYVPVALQITEPFRGYVGRYRSRAVRGVRGTAPAKVAGS